MDATPEGRPERAGPDPGDVVAVTRTTCCIVGAGPAGAVLGLLLARAGVPVVLLEAHGDFDRDFRGDSLHPAILEVFNEVGLADRLLALPHRRIRTATLPLKPPVSLDFARLRSRTDFAFLTMMPQARFLEFVTTEAGRYPAFSLRMRASARELIEADGQIRGVRYRAADGWHELRAPLTVAADGRASRMRRASRLPVTNYGSPIDVVWFRLPRRDDDPEGVAGGVAGGRLVLMVDRGDTWQLGMLIPKGTWRRLRAGGVETLHQVVAHVAPWLAARATDLADWRQVAVLSVQTDLLDRWWRPGLLLIGDAAHAMSPIAGNGINYAIADAVATANGLAGPLADGIVRDRDLAAVQRRRRWPTRITQVAVAGAQRGLATRIGQDTTSPPALVRALLRSPAGALGLRLAAFGLRPEHVAAHLRHPTPEPHG